MFDYKHKVYGFHFQASDVVDLHRQGVLASTKTLNVSSTAYPKSYIDLDWIPFASEKYNISSNPKDYVLVPVVAVVSDIPNRNLQAFKQEDLIEFSPDFGMLRYKTFIGKPTHIDHINDDYTQAKGVILDAEVRRYGNLLKIVVLSAWDKTRDVNLVNSILRKERKYYSMGAWAQYFECSICGHNLSTNGNCIHHRRGSGGIFDNQLAFVYARNPVFFELSSVETPAYISAEGKKLMKLETI